MAQPLAGASYPSQLGMSLFELRRFLDTIIPEDSKKTAALKAKYNRERKAVLIPQLWYHEIAHSPTAFLPALEKLLRAAFLAGKLTENPPRLLECKRLQEEEEQRRREEERLKDEAFLAATPVERAEMDLDRFMSFQFLTNGRPDRSKTTEPLALYGAKRHLVHEAAGLIPGLETTSGGQGDSRTVCVGWDRSAVYALAREIGADAYKKIEEASKAKWDEVMETHRSLVEKLVKPAMKGKKKTAGKKKDATNNLAKCAGSYIIRCDMLDTNHGSTDFPTIDIEDSGLSANSLVAAMDFGSIEGTMLLAFSEDELNEIVAEENGKGGYDSEDPYDEDEDEDEEEEENVKKRKAPAAKPKRGRPQKKSKRVASSPLRLHFQFKGRETGEGEMFYDPYKGYFDFTDDNFTAFKGKIDIPHVGVSVDIEGFKVDESAQTTAEDWSNFSKAAYESAEKRRWGGSGW